jgi:hypothetical protein
MSRLESVRESPSASAAATALVAAIGLGLALFHWSAFLAGGIAIGLLAPTIRRALANALGFALGGIVLFFALLWEAGALSVALASGELLVLALALPIGLSLLGSLVRLLR